MLQQPRKTKFRKQQKGRIRGLASSGTKVSFGEYGLKCLMHGRLNAREIEAARRAMVRSMRRSGRVWIRIFPDKPITRKPLEVRMGKGKGSVEYWVAVVKPGKLLYEIGGVPREVADKALRLAAAKLSVRTRFVERTVL